jgi:osmotically inducible protein OsmC
MSIDPVLYQAHVKATGGRDGHAVSSDGALDVRLSTPRALGGAGRQGTNPEQLFAAAYAACFLSAMKYVAARDTLAIPPEISVESTVGIGATVQGFGLEVELRIALPGLSERESKSLIHKAHVVCPYSNATRGNIAVRLLLVSSHP